jgi:hypothetical protein
MKIEIDKPVIPQFVADWIEQLYGQGFNSDDLLEALFSRNYEVAELKTFEWFTDDKERAVTAILYGYEVEEEQKYNVKFKVKSSFGTVGIFLYKEGDEVLAGDNFKVYYPKEDVYRLTEQEIRDFQNGDILFEHFAVKVEEAE